MNICPRCMMDYKDLDWGNAALSRRDNKTSICSDCGREEAMLDFIPYKDLTDSILAKEYSFQNGLKDNVFKDKYYGWLRWKRITSDSREYYKEHPEHEDKRFFGENEQV